MMPAYFACNLAVEIEGPDRPDRLLQDRRDPWQIPATWNDAHLLETSGEELPLQRNWWKSLASTVSAAPQVTSRALEPGQQALSVTGPVTPFTLQAGRSPGLTRIFGWDLDPNVSRGLAARRYAAPSPSLPGCFLNGTRDVCPSVRLDPDDLLFYALG
ncbi:hypothetical protein PG993_015185 [Apiospora rasikravindrae]|uniref:Uncharacterized protein n=1 Tax=Apiospora rasikravindrae TaxID=990691 RepID=A0ABR1RPU4_9PEZI